MKRTLMASFALGALSLASQPAMAQSGDELLGGPVATQSAQQDPRGYQAGGYNPYDPRHTDQGYQSPRDMNGYEYYPPQPSQYGSRDGEWRRYDNQRVYPERGYDGYGYREETRQDRWEDRQTAGLNAAEARRQEGFIRFQQNVERRAAQRDYEYQQKIQAWQQGMARDNWEREQQRAAWERQQASEYQRQRYGNRGW